MSRVGKKPIEIPEKVNIELEKDVVKVTGPKGTLIQKLVPLISVNVEGGKIMVKVEGDDKKSRAFHGLYRALINNMVIGVSRGFSKTLLINGVGYKASLQGKTLNLQLGYSHPINYTPPEGINIEVLSPTQIRVSGIDKQLVGEVSAQIRSFRKPDVYKGKGIMYEDELIKKKPTKAGAK